MKQTSVIKVTALVYYMSVVVGQAIYAAYDKPLAKCLCLCPGQT